MPKLKKRRNVPSQRQRRKVTQPKPITDHTYCALDDNSNIPLVQKCLQEEVKTACITNELFEEHSFRPDVEYMEPPDQIVHCLDHVPSFEDPEDPIEYTAVNLFDHLKEEVRHHNFLPYTCNPNSEIIQILQLYPSTDKVAVKMNITIDKKFTAKVYIHRVAISADHDIWIGLPRASDSIVNITALLHQLNSYTVCVGNYEADLIDIIPVGSAVDSTSDSVNCRGYREGDFGATKGNIAYSSTVRNVGCCLLVQGNGCSPCSKLRRVLISRKHRREEKRKELRKYTKLS